MLVNTKKNSLLMSFLITTAFSATAATASDSDSVPDLAQVGNLSVTSSRPVTPVQNAEYNDTDYPAILITDVDGTVTGAKNNVDVLYMANEAAKVVDELAIEKERASTLTEQLRIKGEEFDQQASLLTAAEEAAISLVEQLRIKGEEFDQQALLLTAAKKEARQAKDQLRIKGEEFDNLQIRFDALQGATDNPPYTDLFTLIQTLSADTTKYSDAASLIQELRANLDSAYERLKDVQSTADTAASLNLSGNVSGDDSDEEEEQEATLTLADYQSFSRIKLNGRQKMAVRGFTEISQYEEYFKEQGITFG